MIKIDELSKFLPTYKYTGGENVTFQVLIDNIKEEAQKYAVPVEFYNDQVKSGGIFNREIEECIVVYHPEHKTDYYNFCIRIKRVGSIVQIQTDVFGSSVQMDKFARAEKAFEDRQGKSVSYKIGSMVGSGLRNMGKNKQKLEEEELYYDTLRYVLREALG